MANENLKTGNPEDLHNIADKTASPTDGSFVNKGTSAQALASLDNLTSPELSKERSQTFRDTVLKTNK